MRRRRRRETPDPHITMREIRIEFDDASRNYSTNINGTRAEIVAYFSQGPLNLGKKYRPAEDELHRVRRIVFLDCDITVTL